MLGVSDYTRTAWLDFLSELEDSVLLCDTAALELAHWSITVEQLVTEHRVVNVHHTADPVVEYDSSSIFLLVGEFHHRWSNTRFLIIIPRPTLSYT